MKDEQAVLDAIANLPDYDRVIAEKLHAVIMKTAPSLMPRTWYGMPAYSNGQKIVCWFRGRDKFGERYITFGFNDVSKLDDGVMWPITYAVTDVDEDAIARLVQQAVGAGESAQQ